MKEGNIVEKIKDLAIHTNRKYLVISKSTSFLEKLKTVIYNKLNISDIYDTKRHKNHMSFETIILKKGGFIKFFLYTNNNLMKCTYDTVIIDSTLYATEYSNIRSKCLMANILVVSESDEMPESLLTYKEEVIENNTVVERSFDEKNLSDYGKCPKCNTIVYMYDKLCPGCRSELDWTLNKDDIIRLCEEYGEFNNNLGNNIMHCSENWYNRYYCLRTTFGMEKLKAMSEEELNNLLALTDSITQGLY